MTISVVIATYNRATLLSACLRALEGQAFEPGDEIVVADNGSTDDTPGVVDGAAQRFRVPVRLVREPRPGKSHALAAAVASCGADVLAFTDDDVLVAPDWVARIRDVMSTTAAALVGGKVLPLLQARVPDWLDLGSGRGFGPMGAPLALTDYGPSREVLGPRTAMAGNMAIRRAVFDAVGGFSGSLGKLRGTLLSGEDHHLSEQVQAAGHLALYEPAMVIRHLVPADRLRVGYFLRWFFWSGVTHARLDATRALRPAMLLGVPRYLFRQLIGSAAMATGAALRAGWSQAMFHATRAAFALGYLWSAWSSPAPRPARPVTGPRTEAA
jgi:glycosyltransferase involved in cell wall biosynthesis